MKTVKEIAREAGDVLNKEWLERFAELVRADEREACAGECDEWIKNGSALAEDIAAAIRARSNT